MRFPGGGRVFSVSDGIRTESSHKYSADSFSQLLERGGWQVQHVLTDGVDAGAAQRASAAASADSVQGSSADAGLEASHAVFIAHA